MKKQYFGYIKKLCILVAASLLFCTQAFGSSSNAQNGISAKPNSYESVDLYNKLLNNLDKQSYGGMYLDDNGNLNILTTNNEQTSEIVNECKYADQSVIFRNAKYSRKEIEDVYNSLIPQMQALGITDMGIDDINNCVTIGIYQLDNMDKQARNELEQSIHNFAKSDCINIVNDATKSHDQTQYTVLNGCGLNNYSDSFSLCMGVSWTDNGTQKYGFLTAGHALSVGQSAYYGNQQTLMGKCVNSIQNASLGVDAAVIQSSTSPNTFKPTNQFTDGSTYDMAAGNSGGKFPVGTNVTLYGATSAKITGTITNTDWTDSSGYAHVVKTSYISKGGDSGGAVKASLNYQGTTYNYIIGIHRAGDNTTYGEFCDIGKVMNALNIDDYYK